MHVPTPRRARALALAGSAAAGAALALPWPTAPAGATNEFPPNPVAEAEITCYQGGAKVTVTYTNIGGVGPATFHPVVDGVAQAAVSLPAGGDDIVQYDTQENDSPLVEITADGGYAYTTQLGPVNCIEYTGSIEFECRPEGPTLIARADRMFGYGAWEVVFEHPGGTESAYPYTFAEWEVLVAEDAPYSATLGTFEQDLDSIQGYADCEQPPPPPPSTTVPEPTTTTTVPAPTTTAPVPTTVADDPDPVAAPVEVASVAQTPPAPPAAPRAALPRTGATAASLGATALGLLAAGTGALAAAGRRVRARRP